MVSDATPLSRFMVEVAREGCDLDTAEGRAMLATQAKPLWSALPEGVLKTQLLGELAELVGIGERELLRLWQGTAASPNDRRRGATRTGKSWPTAASGPAVRGVSLRRQIPSRQDRALQILFADMQQWAALSPALQHLLMDLAPPHGRLFSWLDQQWHEHGVQPLAALREGLRGHDRQHALGHGCRRERIAKHHARVGKSPSGEPNRRVDTPHGHRPPGLCQHQATQRTLGRFEKSASGIIHILTSATATPPDPANRDTQPTTRQTPQGLHTKCSPTQLVCPP
jgi:hypothetical protein